MTKSGKNWQSEMEANKHSLSEEESVSDNISVSVTSQLLMDTLNDGSTEVNMHLVFAYETKNVIVNAETDDYPMGAYNRTTSNACKFVCNFMKEKVENELAAYLTDGRKVTTKITGETDGTPIRGKIAYKGEYGDFIDKVINLNGEPSTITVTTAKGITTNAQLAFLRTQGVEDFMRNNIPLLQKTDNEYINYAVENQNKGDAYRRVAIEMVIHDVIEKEDLK